MNKFPEAITITTANLKPIRCSAKTVPFMDGLDEAMKKTMCQGTVIGVMADQVLLLNPEPVHGFDVTGAPYIGGTGSYPKRQIKLSIDGKTYALEIIEIDG